MSVDPRRVASLSGTGGTATWADVRLWLDRFFADYKREVLAIVERHRAR